MTAKKDRHRAWVTHGSCALQCRFTHTRAQTHTNTNTHTHTHAHTLSPSFSPSLYLFPLPSLPPSLYLSPFPPSPPSPSPNTLDLREAEDLRSVSLSPSPSANTLDLLEAEDLGGLAGHLELQLADRVLDVEDLLLQQPRSRVPHNLPPPDTQARALSLSPPLPLLLTTKAPSQNHPLPPLDCTIIFL